MVTNKTTLRPVKCRPINSLHCTILSVIFPTAVPLRPDHTGSGNTILCIRKQDTLLPFLATKPPVSGYKVSCFGNQCGQAIKGRRYSSKVFHGNTAITQGYSKLLKPNLDIEIRTYYYCLDYGAPLEGLKSRPMPSKLRKRDTIR